MKITLQNTAKGHLIQSYGPGQVVVNQHSYNRSLIITPARIIPDWRPQSMQALTISDLETIFSLDPGIVLLGTGKTQIFPPAEIVAEVATRGIGIEYMDTAAACRTYNVLAVEGRRVVVGLMLD